MCALGMVTFCHIQVTTLVMRSFLSLAGEVTQWDSSLLCRALGLMPSPKRKNLANSNYLRKFQLLIKVILIFDILWGKNESMLSLEVHIAH